MFRNLSHNKLFQIRESFRITEWSENCNEPNAIFDEMYVKCEQVVNPVALIRDLNNRSKDLAWYDAEVRDIAFRRDALYKAFPKRRKQGT